MGRSGGALNLITLKDDTKTLNDNETAENLVAAITGAAGEGTTYGTGTEAHPYVTASNVAGVVTVTALNAGTVANAQATTETSAVGSWGAATLEGGEDLPLKAIKSLIWPQDNHAVT